MSARALFVLANDHFRAKAIDAIRHAPKESRVEIKGPRRTLDQNARMWAMLTNIADQATHCGRKYTTDQWKCIFLHACGREVQFIPSLDGSGFIPWGQSSSDLSIGEMSDLIECMFAWGAENGIEWSDPTIKDQPEAGRAA